MVKATKEAKVDELVMVTSADEIGVKSAAPLTPLSSRLKKADSTGKKRKRVEFTPEAPQTKEFEIEEGNRFSKLPSMAKMKQQANKWTNVFTISAAKKKMRVDEVEVAIENREREEKAAKELEEAATAAKQAKADAAAAKSAALKEKQKKAGDRLSFTSSEVEAMTPKEKEQKFEEVAKQSFIRAFKNGKTLQLNNMVKDLKASGLMEYIKATHGVKKWFLNSDTFGLNIKDNFVSMKGHNDSFLEDIISILQKAPKYMMKMHQLMTSLRARISENGVRNGLRGYPSLEAFILANNKNFLISKKGNFVTIKEHLKIDATGR